jgi:hypothetical protein
MLLAISTTPALTAPYYQDTKCMWGGVEIRKAQNGAKGKATIFGA